MGPVCSIGHICIKMCHWDPLQRPLGYVWTVTLKQTVERVSWSMNVQCVTLSQLVWASKKQGHYSDEYLDSCSTIRSDFKHIKVLFCIYTVKRQKIRGVLISWISWWALTHEINTPRKYSKYLLLVRPNCPPTKITCNEMDLSPQTTKLSSHELLPFYSILAQ